MNGLELLKKWMRVCSFTTKKKGVIFLRASFHLPVNGVEGGLCDEALSVWM